MKAMDRGVNVCFVCPGQGIGAAVHVKKATDKWVQDVKNGKASKSSAPKYSEIFLESLPKLAKYSTKQLCLAALVNDENAPNYEHIYVHSKLAIIDEEFLTVGSANLVDLSFEKDHTELNVSVWGPLVAKTLQSQLIEEHTNEDTSKMDPKDVFGFLLKTAANNRSLFLQGKSGFKGNLIALDPALYCSSKF